MYQLLILGLFTLVSCGVGKANPTYVNLSEDEQYQVALYLADLTPTTIPIKVEVVDTIKGYPNAVGLAIRGLIPCHIQLKASLFGPMSHILKTVVWHEYGHCMGLDHTESHKEVMAPSASSFISLSMAVILRFKNQIKELSR